MKLGTMTQTEFKSDIEIAREARMKPVIEIAKERFGISEDHLDPYGHYKAKLSLDYLAEQPELAHLVGRLLLPRR